MTQEVAPRLRAALETMNSAGWTRDDAHALLDAALDLVACAGDAESELGRLAQAAALTLSRTVAGWMVPIEHTEEEWNKWAGLAPRKKEEGGGFWPSDPGTWRKEAIERMRLTPASLPQPVIEALMFALMDLQRGGLPPLFKSTPRDAGYGKDPTSRRVLEQAMLMWIEVEKARGRPASKVQDEVAAAVVIQTRDGIETWKREWHKRDRRRVDEVLSIAVTYALGKEITPPIPTELVLILIFMSENGSPLRGLADSWKAAKA